VAKFSALRSGRPLLPKSFLILISVKGRVEPKAVFHLEGLGQLETRMTSLETNDDLPLIHCRYIVLNPDCGQVTAFDKNIFPSIKKKVENPSRL
jgi:hypothetical protein